MECGLYLGVFKRLTDRLIGSVNWIVLVLTELIKPFNPLTVNQTENISVNSVN